MMPTKLSETLSERRAQSEKENKDEVSPGSEDISSAIRGDVLL
jgi:hypothetical protein